MNLRTSRIAARVGGWSLVSGLMVGLVMAPQARAAEPKEAPKQAANPAPNPAPKEVPKESKDTKVVKDVSSKDVPAKDLSKESKDPKVNLAPANSAPTNPAPANSVPAGQLVSGPSLRETGRIGPMFVQGGGVEIPRKPDTNSPKENSVQTASDVAERPLSKPRAGVIDQVVLDRQIENRFAAVQECRVEVARKKKLTPARITAGPVTVRWTILTSGAAASTAVVVTSPADLDLIDCVKKQMGLWTFTRPRGGPVNVERTLTFR